MGSLTKRIILTFTSVPALFALIYFLPHYHHVGFALLTVWAVYVGSKEISHILFFQDKPLFPHYFTVLLPIAQFIQLFYLSEIPLVSLIFVVLLSIGFIREVFTGIQDSFEHTISRLSRTAFLAVYPGFFSVFLLNLLPYHQATWLLLMLFLLVFGNDTFAYIFGMWLGKGNRNIFAVSPNKSLAGFIGGTFSTMILSVVWTLSIPAMREVFTVVQSLVVGLILSISSNLGDLIESALKRGAHVKDSGTIIMGRGGIMDSIDSLLMSAPFFLICIELFT